MAFHVRITKHNFLQFAKTRRLRYPLQSSVIHEDRLGKRIGDGVNCIQTSCQHCQGTHMHLKTRRSQSSEDLVNELAWRSRNSSVNPSGILKNEVSNNMNAYVHIASRDLQKPNRKLSESLYKSQSSYVPVALHDIHSLLLGHCEHPFTAVSQSRDSDIKKCFLSMENLNTAKSTVNTQDTITSTLFEANTDENSELRHTTSHCVSADNRNLPNMNIVLSDMAKTPDDTPQSNDAEKLIKMNERKEHFQEQFYDLFVRTHQYGIYRVDMVFENNYYGQNDVIRGLREYAMFLFKIRTWFRVKFSNVRVQILQASVHTDDSTIRFRWRISGLGNLKILRFWRYWIPTRKTRVDKESDWYDGVAIIHLDKDYLIHKIRIERVITDDNEQTVKVGGMAAKLALLIGLVPKSAFDGFSSGLFMKKLSAAPK